MQFIKIGQTFINMAQVHQIEHDTTINTLYIYTSELTIRITDPEQQTAVLAWLGRNSINVLTRRDP